MFQVIHNFGFSVKFHFQCAGHLAHRQAMRDSWDEGANYFEEIRSRGPEGRNQRPGAKAADAVFEFHIIPSCFLMQLEKLLGTAFPAILCHGERRR
jgi:hypothetical protein